MSEPTITLAESWERRLNEYARKEHSTYAVYAQELRLCLAELRAAIECTNTRKKIP